MYKWLHFDGESQLISCDIELLCVYIEILRVIIGSHNLLIPGCYMYMQDEVFIFLVSNIEQF
jgi:hypothetical protein